MTNQENEAIVRAFFAGMGPSIEEFKKTYRDFLTDDVEWESVGGTPHIGIEDSVKHLDELFEQTGMAYCEIEVLNIASNGDVVMTERVDHMLRADGSTIFDFRIMGTFVLRDGRIARYTDYYDSLGAARALGRL